MNPDGLDRFASRVADRMERTYDAYDRGDIDRTELTAAALAILTVADDQGVRVADFALAAWLTHTTGTPVATTGTRPRARDLTAALSAALTVSHDVRGRLGRTGRDVALQAAQTGYVDAIRQHGVAGWTRVPNTDACHMCRDLSEAVLPASVDPWHHAGCQCGIRPVMDITKGAA